MFWLSRSLFSLILLTLWTTTTWGAPSGVPTPTINRNSTKQIYFERVGDTLVPFIYLSGRFPQKHWNLLVGTDQVRRDKDGRFQTKVRVQSGENRIQLSIVAPSGWVQRTDYLFQITNLDNLILSDGANGRLGSQGGPSRVFLTQGLSWSMINYRDTRLPAGVDAIDMQALTMKLSYLYLLLPPKWDVSASAYYTAAQLTSTVEDTTRFFGANFRAGYSLLPQGGKWQVNLGGGFFYTTMIVPEGGYGFIDAVGPQIIPVVRRLLPHGRSLSWYNKASLITGGWEYATGLAFALPLKNGNSWTLNLDLAQLQVQIGEVQMISRSLSLGVGFIL